MTRQTAPLAVLLAGGLLTALASGAWGFRVREAPAADDSDCSWSYGDCGDPGPFTRWFTYDVPYFVNMDAETDASDPGLTQAEIISAVQASYQAWEDVPASVISFSYAGETGARISSLDKLNTTLWYKAADDAHACTGAMGAAGGTLAMTISTIRLTGEIVDVDIVFDSADPWDWSTACISFDVQSSMTHEVGHMIGFGHSEGAVCPAAFTKPTMCSGYFCDAGVAGRRSLEADDMAAVQCLYPELPTVLLLDQTGSMSTGSRMADAQEAANAFVDAFPGNQIAIAAFAQGSAGLCGVERPGYELLQDWTDDAGLLHAAINSTSPCGSTPLWESLCCAVDKAVEMDPSNAVVFTDTEENASDGDCLCTTFGNVLDKVDGTGVVFYVVDMTNYFGKGTILPALATGDLEPAGAQTDGDSLAILAKRTGGLYFNVQSPSQLLLARLEIQRHIAEHGKGRQRPTDCFPGPFPIDVIQRYLPDGTPDSPFTPNEEVTVNGTLTAKEGTFDPGVRYLEDCSGGIRFLAGGAPTGGLGEAFEVRGFVGTVGGEIAITQLTGIKPLGPGLLPEPPVEYPRTMSELELVGRIVTAGGFVGGPVVDERFPLISGLEDPVPDTIPIFLHPNTGIPATMFSPGQYYEVTGILTRAPGRNEIAPRDASDLRFVPVAVDPGPEPSRPGLLAVEPNPFRAETRLHYALTRSGPVRVEIYDVAGRLIRGLVNQRLPSGRYVAHWDGRDGTGAVAGPGVYFLRFAGPDGIVEKRSLVFLR